MTFIRCYADAAGESHFEDVTVTFDPFDLVPPGPPLHLSPMMAATGMAFVRFPAGRIGDWRPSLRRQVFIFLAGELEGETSDGDRRRYGPGSVVLVEDTTGKGHRSWVVGDDDALAAVVLLPD